ncbi:SLATT domain-containing protein [Edwardsiella anguillarum]|nr:SLATT domain-containing protein [Edwardsiella anguillarum]
MTNEEIIMEGQLRECYGRVVYSHKTHEKCADILMRNHEYIKLAHIGFSVLITGGIVTTLLSDSKAGVIISAILSTIVLFLNTYTKNYDLGELAQKHRQAAADLWVIREEYLSLLTDVRISDLPLDVIRARRDELMKNYMRHTPVPPERG